MKTTFFIENEVSKVEASVEMKPGFQKELFFVDAQSRLWELLRSKYYVNSVKQTYGNKKHTRK